MITGFHIRGFRGYNDTEVLLGKNTCIIGGNGSGKTHILEGIHLCSGATLHYVQAPRSENSEFEIRFSSDIGMKTFSRTRLDEKDTYKIQGTRVSGVHYTTNLPYRTVFVSPFDMNLFYFSPGYRREYIDSILERTFAQFRSVRRDYENVMRQRNALLKQIRDGIAERNMLDYWDTTFSEKALLYHLYRMKWVEHIRRHIDYIHTYLPEYIITHIYESKLIDLSNEYTCSLEETLRKYLEEHREKDILTGHTHIGAHLDDFSFMIEKDGIVPIESSLFLSRGENKVLLLALKQVEILFIRKYLELPIVLLFDDIFAELDLSHAEILIGSFEAEQVIITSQRPLPDGENWAYFSCINLNSEYHAKKS